MTRDALTIDERRITPPPARPSPVRHLAYRPDIDGLRALAIVPVVLFHLEVKPFTGGFVGVDIFFVISGYLITSLILHDLASGSFSFATFYERRIRRIFPALFAMTATCAVAALLLLTPGELSHFGVDLAAMTLFVSNIAARYSGAAAGYFAFDSHFDMLLHTWSLSVEEQFYILFPPALLLLRKKGKNISLWLSIVAIASLMLCIIWTYHNEKEAFYFPFTRAWELLIGSVLALWRSPIFSKATREAAALVGMGSVLAAIFGFSQSTMFPGYAAMLPTLGTSLLIYAGLGDGSVCTRLLSMRVPVALGRISYSLYLWHWPVIVFYERTNFRVVKQLDAGQKSAVLVVSLVFAVLSYFLIERPFRTKSAFPSRRGLLRFGVGLTSLFLCCGIGLRLSNGLSSIILRHQDTLVAQNLERLNDHAYGPCSNWQSNPSTISDIHTCALGPHDARKIIFWGDSRVDNLRLMVNRLYDAGTFGRDGVLFTVSNGCPLSVDLRRIDEAFPHCNAFSKVAMQRMLEPDVDAVFVGLNGAQGTNGSFCLSSSDTCLRVLPDAEAMNRAVADLARQFAALKARRIKIILMLPWPAYGASVPEYVIAQLRQGALSEASLHTAPLERYDYEALRAKLTAMAKSYGAVVFDPRADLCYGDICRYEIGHVSIYSDDEHLAVSQTRILEKSLVAAIQAALAK